MEGFFQSSKYLSDKPLSTVPKCGVCRLYKHCISPKMPPTGEGRKKILIVAEAPGATEDEQNVQLIGKAGRRCRRLLKNKGINLDRDCVKTNAVICRPKDNETPTTETIEACRPNLLSTIMTFKPNVIMLLGGAAMESLLSLEWKESIDTVSKWAGFAIPFRTYNCWVIPTYHPSYLERQNDDILDMAFEKHIRLASRRSKSRPWKTVPNYEKEIQIVQRPSKAAKIIKEMTRRGGMVAFDYECNTLKPDGEGTKIVTCSICWKGKKTIAYPWAGETVEATDELLRSPMPKIASNIKFEDRWTRVKLGHPVRNWCWDTMIAAHVLDNRQGITGLKFQAFVRLGQGTYGAHIAPYLSGNKRNRFNRIFLLNKKDLLLYNGLDSLLEYKVAVQQMNLFKRKDR